MNIDITTVKKKIVSGLSALGLRNFIALPGGNPSELDEFWNDSDVTSQESVDHKPWQSLLDNHLNTSAESNVFLFDYTALKHNTMETLENYLAYLLQKDARNLNKSEQLCYWLNLYNALTVRLVAQHYPVKSITELGRQKGRFGPWDDVIAEAQQQQLTLNHIEHRIIRPLYKDYRVHFAMNCASMGCPNLLPQAFTAVTVDELLTLATTQFLSHPRALRFDQDQLIMSSIFDWYESDFGDSFADMLSTLAKHVDQPMADKLINYQSRAVFEYDWNLNAYPHA